METSKFMQITCKLDPSWINRKEIEVLGSAQGLRKVYCESQYAMRGGGMEALWGRCACPEIPEWGSNGQIIWNVPLGWRGLRWTSISDRSLTGILNGLCTHSFPHSLPILPTWDLAQFSCRPVGGRLPPTPSSSSATKGCSCQSPWRDILHYSLRLSSTTL